VGVKIFNLLILLVWLARLPCNYLTIVVVASGFVRKHI
jgi:hypothetical protein